MRVVRASLAPLPTRKGYHSPAPKLIQQNSSREMRLLSFLNTANE